MPWFQMSITYLQNLSQKTLFIVFVLFLNLSISEQ